MKRRYSPAFDPPAAVVPVELRVPGSALGARVEGKLDTGADVCAVPDRLIDELALPVEGTVRAAGYAGELREAAVYRVDIVIDGIVHGRVKALSTRRPYAIVGRNVLRRLVVRLDGPREQLELRTPPPRAT